MGPANSEPLLISLAAELEALNGWAMRQPDVWWDRGQPAPSPKLVPEPAIADLADVEPVRDEVA
jgi:amidase